MTSEAAPRSAPARTLVFHQAALGDFVLTWPLLRRLPGPVAVVAPWGHASLAAATLAEAPGVPGVTTGVPGVVAVGVEQFEFTRMHSPGGPSALSPAVRELFESAAAVIGFVAPPGGDWAANAARLMPGATRVLLDPRPPEGFGGHATAWHAEVVGGRVPLRDPVCPPVAPARPADAPVLLHPGSGGVMKCWARGRFAGLARRLVAAGHRVRFVLGEAEADRWGPAELAELAVEGVPLERIDGLDALAERVRGCRLYVGNDAGPTHLAAQLGAPTLALFGPSAPHRFHPVGPAAGWLAPPVPTAMHWLSVDAVEAEVLRVLSEA